MNGPHQPFTHRPLVGVCVGFALGIIFNLYVDVPLPLLLFLLGLFLVLSLCVDNKNVSAVLMVATIVFAGWTYARNYQALPSNHITHSYDEDNPHLLLEGVVVSDAAWQHYMHGRKTVFTLELKARETHGQWQSSAGLVQVHLFREADIQYGERLLLEGRLHPPFMPPTKGRSSYEEYLHRQGIFLILSVRKNGRMEIVSRDQCNMVMQYSLQCKHYFQKILHQYLGKKEAGIMQAFILGEREGIPRDMMESFTFAGVAHIIAVSGFNVGIVAFMILMFLKMLPIPRLMQYVLTMVLLVFYALLTGAQPPVVRATITAVIVLMGFIVEHEAEPINSLATAALIILMFNPLNLFDVGFQLSFASVLAILLFYNKMVAAFYRWLKVDEPPKVMAMVVQSVSMSLVAYGGVALLVIYYFQIITPVAILANLIIVPLSSLIIVLGLGLLATGVLIPWIAFSFANVLILLLYIMVISVNFFAQLPGAYFRLP